MYFRLYLRQISFSGLSGESGVGGSGVKKFSIKCDWIGFYKMNFRDRSLFQLHRRGASAVPQPLPSTVIRVRFEWLWSVIVRRSLWGEQKVGKYSFEEVCRCIHTFRKLQFDTSRVKHSSLLRSPRTFSFLILIFWVCVVVYCPCWSVLYSYICWCDSVIVKVTFICRQWPLEDWWSRKAVFSLTFPRLGLHRYLRLNTQGTRTRTTRTSNSAARWYMKHLDFFAFPSSTCKSDMKPVWINKSPNLETEPKSC